MTESIEALVVGGGQAGLAMSEHLGAGGIPHLVLERDRLAERWRIARWDSLVANGPAWHDRFPTLEFSDVAPDGFASKEQMVDYFVEYARLIEAPVRCGVEVLSVRRRAGRAGFAVRTTEGELEARHVVAATGPFQRPRIPAIVPADAGPRQLHSSEYRNPGKLPAGAVLVVGAGSSGVQIADELLAAGRDVFLSVGSHDRPPRRYRGRDFVWWLGVLGRWDAETPPQGAEHVTIAVSGANGGRTIDFRELAARGMELVGTTRALDPGAGTLRFDDDLAANLEAGDASYLALLDEADAYVTRTGIELPAEPAARQLGPLPAAARQPRRELDLSRVGTIIWATGFTADFSWLPPGALREDGTPHHRRGVCAEPGVYVLGLPWLSRRGSSFVWGVWHDARHLADHIATQRSYLAHTPASVASPYAMQPGAESD